MKLNTKLHHQALISNALSPSSTGIKALQYEATKASPYKYLKKTLLKRLFVFFILMLTPKCNNHQPQLIIYENNKTEIQIGEVNFYQASKQ